MFRGHRGCETSVCSRYGHSTLNGRGQGRGGKRPRLSSWSTSTTKSTFSRSYWLACRWGSQGRGQKLNEISTGHYCRGSLQSRDKGSFGIHAVGKRSAGERETEQNWRNPVCPGPASHQVTESASTDSAVCEPL